MERYSRNENTISKKQQALLAKIKVLVIGAGGLGSHVIEGLARMGIMEIGICDYDVFEESNLNRQILALEKTIDQSKCQVAKERINAINSEIVVHAYQDKYPSKQILNDFESYDIVIDCLDNIPIRKQLEVDCLRYDKKLIYGTIAGNFGYFGVISASNRLMDFQTETGDGIEKILGNPYYIVSVVASMQLLLLAKVIFEQEYLKSGFYVIDLIDMSIDKIELN